MFENNYISEYQLNIGHLDIPIGIADKNELIASLTTCKLIFLSGKCGIGKHTLLSLAAKCLKKDISNINQMYTPLGHDPQRKVYFEGIKSKIGNSEKENVIFLVDNLPFASLPTWSNMRFDEYLCDSQVFVFIVDDCWNSYRSIKIVSAGTSLKSAIISIKTPTEKFFKTSIESLAKRNSINIESQCLQDLLIEVGCDFYQAMIKLNIYKSCVAQKFQTTNLRIKYDFLHLVGKFLYNKRIGITGEPQILTRKEMLAIPRPKIYFDIERVVYDNNTTYDIISKYIYCNKSNFMININEISKYLDDVSLLNTPIMNVDYTYSLADELKNVKELSAQCCIRSYLYNNNSVGENKLKFIPIRFDRNKLGRINVFPKSVMEFQQSSQKYMKHSLCPLKRCKEDNFLSLTKAIEKQDVEDDELLKMVKPNSGFKNKTIFP
jgi:hypothetical protein